MANIVKLTYRVAKHISKLGNQHGFTVRTMAAHSRVSPSTIYRFLNSGNDSYNPKIATVEKIAKALNVSMAEIFTFRKPKATAQVTA